MANNRLCKDCTHQQPYISAADQDTIFFSNGGPWCRLALARVQRKVDRVSGGLQPFRVEQLNEAQAQHQRVIYPWLAPLLGMCGSRGRWFSPLPLETKE